MTRNRPDLWPLLYPKLMDKEIVLDALRNNPVYQAANKLGVSTKTLRKVMKYHGIVWPFGSLPDGIQKTFKK